MTFCSIDKRRFAYFLNLGTDDYELRKFFSDRRTALILRGGKVQNLPRNNVERARVIASELPSSTDDVLRSWFSEHVTMSDPVPPEEIVATFRLHEEMNEEIEEAPAKRLARSCLVHLFSDQPPANLLEFLRLTSTGDGRPPETVASSLVVEEVLTNSLPLTDTFAQLLVALTLGQDIDKHLEGLPADVTGFVMGLHAGAQGRLDEARSALESLSKESAFRGRLEQFVAHLEARPLKVGGTGIEVNAVELFEDTFDEATDEVVGYCTKSDPPRSVFVQPIFIRRSGVVKGLNAELRRKLFPANGDVMAFPGAGFPDQPSRGEVCVWTVQEHPTDKATHFHLKAKAQKVYEVIHVPFSSTDFDSVREYLKEYSSSRAGFQHLQPHLFLLADGVIIGQRSEKGDLSKEEVYEQGLLSWDSLAAIRTEGRTFVVGPLPKEQGIYECASISIVARKALRPYLGSGRAGGGITKAQLSELSQLIGSHEAELTTTRVQRIRSELTKLEKNQELLAALVEELLGTTQVREIIDALAKEAAEKQMSEKSSVQNEIVRLKKDREEWEDRIRRQKEDHKKLRDDTSRVVKTAFEKARLEGVGTLAEIAIFKELLGSVHQPASGVSQQDLSLLQPRIRPLTVDAVQDPFLPLKALGLSARSVAAFLAMGQLAICNGLVFCVSGLAARAAAERWARTIGDAVAIDVPVGLIDDSAFQALLRGESMPKTIVLLDANLSPADIYARPLFDLLIEGLSSKANARVINTVVTLSDALGKLAFPKALERISVSFDLDELYDFDANDSEELTQRLFDPNDGSLTKSLWGPAFDRVREYSLNLDAESRKLVLSVLSI